MMQKKRDVCRSKVFEQAREDGIQGHSILKRQKRQSIDKDVGQFVDLVVGR